MTNYHYTIIISIITPFAVAILVYVLNEWSKRKFFEKQALEQRAFEKAKKKYDVKLERYELLSNSLYRMIINLEQLKLLLTVDWDNEDNLENNINLAFRLGVTSMEDETELGTSGIKKTFKSYEELIKKYDISTKKGKKEFFNWVETLVSTLFWVRLRLFNVIKNDFWKYQTSLELIGYEKQIRQKTSDVGKVVFTELLESFSKYELGMKQYIDLAGFIDKITKELNVLREMMLNDLEKTL